MRVRQKPATLHHRAPCVDCIQKSCVQLYYSLFQSDEDIKVGSRDRQQNKVSLTRRAGHNLPLNLRQVRCPRATVGYRMSLQPLAGPAVGYRLLLPPSVTTFCYRLLLRPAGRRSHCRMLPTIASRTDGWHDWPHHIVAPTTPHIACGGGG